MNSITHSASWYRHACWLNTTCRETPLILSPSHTRTRVLTHTPWPRYTPAQFVSHTHTYTRTHTHTHTNTQTHIETPTHTQTRPYTQTHKISLTHTHNHCDTYTSTSSRPHKQTYLYNFTLQNSLKLAFVFWTWHSFMMIQYHSEMKWCQQSFWSNSTEKRL